MPKQWFDFEFDELPFQVVQLDRMLLGNDALFLRFTFQQGLPPGQTRHFRHILEDWINDTHEELGTKYFDDFRFTKGRRVSCWVFIDTGGSGPELSSHLTKLFRSIHDFAPLEKVEIADELSRPP